jgi:hypothetical protein
LETERLYIEKISVDGGPMMKRILRRARGSASGLQKKMSHVTIVLGEKEGQATSRFEFMQKEKKNKAQSEPTSKAKPTSAPKQNMGNEKNQKGMLKRLLKPSKTNSQPPTTFNKGGDGS